MATQRWQHRGVAIRILDIFEEMLESKGISIPDVKQTGDEPEACLYGMTYAELLGRFYPSKEK